MLGCQRNASERLAFNQHIENKLHLNNALFVYFDWIVLLLKTWMKFSASLSGINSCVMLSFFKIAWFLKCLKKKKKVQKHY